MRSALAAFAVAGLAACTSPAQGTPSAPPGPTPAADYRSPRIEAALDGAGRLLHARGYTQEGTEARGFVVEHGTQVVEAQLHAGTCYVVIAVGSRALASLSLAVYDGEGAKVAEPEGAAGSHAAVHFCPVRNGAFWAVARGDEGSGLVALRRYRGPTGIDVRLDDLLRDAPGAP